MAVLDSAYVNTESTSTDPSQDLSNPNNASQWVVIHDNLVVGFYGSQEDAFNAKTGYQMNNSIDINSNLEMYQVI